MVVMRFARAWLLSVSFSLAGPPVEFRNVAERAGVRFVLDQSPTPGKRMIETMAGGVAAFDYNNDGRPDLFFANGAAGDAMIKDGPRYWNRLYRNDGGMKFTDVTAEAGLAGTGFSMGAAAADFDNDGNVDLFVPGVGQSTLYRNLGNGKFEDVSAKAGIVDRQWVVAAGWFDYDNDGKLDLWLVHYTAWPPATDRFCGDSERKVRVYCHPKYFQGLPSRLYHNLGDGKFEDVTAASGLAKHASRGMSVVFGDYDGDGLPDAFITNDNEPNFLFHNLHRQGRVSRRDVPKPNGPRQRQRQRLGQRSVRFQFGWMERSVHRQCACERRGGAV